jgi:hypothetical protein
MAIPEEDEPTVRITSAARKELHDEFTKQSYGKNFHFTKSTMPEGLKAIASQYTLKASQVQRQLCAWKGVAHGFHGIVYSHDTEKVKEAIACYCPSDTPDFVKSTLRAMIPSCWGDLVEKPNDYEWLVSMCNADPTKETMLQAILSDASTMEFLVKWVKQYTIFAADAFPRTASMLRAGDSEFTHTRLLKKREGQVEFLELANDLTLQGIERYTLQRSIEMLWKSVYENIEDKLFRRWAIHSFQLHLAEISFPEVFSVHKYSMGVLYFTGGWIVSSLDKAGGKSSEHRPGLIQNKLESMKELASKQSITKDQATSEGLPTGVIDRREMHELRRPSRAFYDFLTRIEAIYMENLTIDMMLSHSDGGLLSAIAAAIIDNEGVRSNFLELVSESTDPRVYHSLLAYVLNKYKRMRGRWFQKAIMGQTCKGSDAVSKMPTRLNVAAKSEAATAVSRATAKSEATTAVSRATSNEPVPTETINPKDANDVHITRLYSNAEKAMENLSSDEMFEIDSDDEADLERDDDDQSDNDDD